MENHMVITLPYQGIIPEHITYLEIRNITDESKYGFEIPEHVRALELHGEMRSVRSQNTSSLSMHAVFMDCIPCTYPMG
jgi:hypothetical protein